MQALPSLRTHTWATSASTKTEEFFASAKVEPTFRKPRSFRRKLAKFVMGPRSAHALVEVPSVESNKSSCHLLAGNLIESTYYQVMMICVILFNMGVLIRETDMRGEGLSSAPWIVASTWVCLVVYAVDLAIRVYVFRLDFPLSFTNVFDTVIVLMDIIIVTFSSTLGDLSLFSVLRGMRMLRVVRVLRQFLNFRELYLMVQGLVSAARSIMFGSIMMIVVLTMLSIMAVEIVHPVSSQLAEDGYYDTCERCGRAFVSVSSSNLSFMLTVLSGDQFGLLCVPIIEKDPWAAVIIMAAFASLQLGLMNVIAAVVVDRQSQAREEDEKLVRTLQAEKIEASYKRLWRLFEKMDGDHNGALTREEILGSYETQEEFKEIMNLMDINESDLATVFDILDIDGSGDVSYPEFVEQLHAMKTRDPHTILVFLRHKIEQIFDMLKLASAPSTGSACSTTERPPDPEDLSVPLPTAEIRHSNLVALVGSLANGQATPNVGSIEALVVAELGEQLRSSIAEDLVKPVVNRVTQQLQSPLAALLPVPEQEKGSQSVHVTHRGECLQPASCGRANSTVKRGENTTGTAEATHSSMMAGGWKSSMKLSMSRSHDVPGSAEDLADEECVGDVMH